MATNLKKVQPGDIVESDLMNQIIDTVEGLEVAVSSLGWSTGTVVVPPLFGKTLNSAMTTINQPQTKLKLGNTIDAYGAALDPNQSDTRQRIIIGQTPPADARVSPNTFINLLLSVKPATGGGGGGGNPTQPTISSFNPAKTPLGEKVRIFGTNFDPDPAQNKISFADVDAGLPEQSSQTQLLVRVPKDIPSPPTGNSEKTVSVTVKCPNGIATGEMILLAALAGDAPTITTIVGADPDFLVVGEIATITGTNFSANIQENKITFGTTETFPETSGNSTTKLKVKVPSPPNIQTGIPVFLDVSVTVNGRQSNIIHGKEIDKP